MKIVIIDDLIKEFTQNHMRAALECQSEIGFENIIIETFNETCPEGFKLDGIKIKKWDRENKDVVLQIVNNIKEYVSGGDYAIFIDVRLGENDDAIIDQQIDAFEQADAEGETIKIADDEKLLSVRIMNELIRNGLDKNKIEFYTQGESNKVRCVMTDIYNLKQPFELAENLEKKIFKLLN